MVEYLISGTGKDLLPQGELKENKNMDMVTSLKPEVILWNEKLLFLKKYLSLNKKSWKIGKR